MSHPDIIISNKTQDLSTGLVSEVSQVGKDQLASQRIEDGPLVLNLWLCS